MEELTITLTAAQLAVVMPLLAGINQVVVKPFLPVDGKKDKIIPIVSLIIGVVLNCLLFGGWTPVNAIAGVMMGLGTCGGYDVYQAPRDLLKKGGA